MFFSIIWVKNQVTIKILKYKNFTKFFIILTSLLDPNSNHVKNKIIYIIPVRFFQIFHILFTKVFHILKKYEITSIELKKIIKLFVFKRNHIN